MDQQTLDTGTPELLCAVEDHIATITLNRPEKRNALSDRLTPALRECLLKLEADPNVRVIVLTGAGGAFCAGGDVSGMDAELREQKTGTTPPAIDDAIRSLQHKQETLTLRLVNLAKPTIAALPGPAAGAGLSLALACDIRIAAESAFLVPSFGKVGLSGDYGGSWFLAKLIGPGGAKEFYFTGRRMDAREALALGIFNEMVPGEVLPARTRELAGEIAAGPPIAIRYMKENIDRAATGDLKTCLAMEADRTIRCLRSRDHREGVEAFLAKRQPRFEGR